MSRFTVGEVVTCRSACSYDTVWAFTVVKRTEKFVTLQDGDRLRRVGIKMWDGREYALPLGSFSMAPIVYGGGE